MPIAIAPNVPTVLSLSLSPPRPLSNNLFPLQEDHILALYKASENGTKLPTDVESIVKEQNIHPQTAAQYRTHLEDVANVYGTAKEHSTAFRAGVTGLILELNTGIILLAQDFEVMYPKLHSYINYSDSRTALIGIIDSFHFSLSNLILKTAHVIDTMGEADKSIRYGQKHVGRVHTQAAAVMKTTTIQTDLNKLASSVSPAVTTILAMQGGFAHLMVNFSAVKSKVESGVTDPSQIYSDKSTEGVINAWTELKEKAQDYKELYD